MYVKVEEKIIIIRIGFGVLKKFQPPCKIGTSGKFNPMVERMNRKIVFNSIKIDCTIPTNSFPK